MSLSFVAFVSCSDDKDNPVNNENTRTENSNGGNGGSNDNGSQLSNDSQPKNGSQPGNVAENSSSVVYYSGMEGGRSYVDLGLTSGTKWATCNVGATKPEEYGNYYAWGETATKETYGWNTYKYGSAYNQLTKYCNSSFLGKDGFTDTKTTLDLSDDAAYVNWGGKWRMPTKAQLDELGEQCYCVWTDSYNNSDVKGHIYYKAKNSGDKGKFVYKGKTPSSSYSLSDAHIFLPCAGSRGFGRTSPRATIGLRRCALIYIRPTQGAFTLLLVASAATMAHIAILVFWCAQSLNNYI